MSGNRVLIIDDEAQIRRLVSRLLQVDGIDVLMAESTAEAERLLEGGPVDLVLCDHFMPDENGLPFLRRMKKRFPDTSRVLMTGSGDVQVGVEAINKAQVCRCITKPFEGGALRAAVRDILDAGEIVGAPREKSFTQENAQVVRNLDFDRPGIADVRRSARGAVVIEDDFDTLHDSFGDWSDVEDSNDVKTHEDILKDSIVKLVGS